MTERAKYLCLAKPEFAQTWVNGGTVPLLPARTYLDLERKGTQTPDEVMQKAITGAALAELRAAGVVFAGEGTIVNVTFENSSFNGPLKPRVTYSQRAEEALILCMCNRADEAVMRRLGKTVIVKIPSIAALQECLDPQVGVSSTAGRVEYTTEEGNRSHFLKGVEDSWQDEYRLVWTGPGIGTGPLSVLLSPGLAEFV